jgi:hypothetical protein
LFPRRYCAVAIVALASCAAEPGEVTLLVPEPMLGLVDTLDADWEALGAEATRLTVVSAGPGVPLLLATLEAMPALCDADAPEGTLVAGCVTWMHGSETEPRAIYIAADSTFSVSDLVRHELGHVFNPNAAHLNAEDGCPDPSNLLAQPPHTMCLRAGPTLTSADAAFVAR